MLSMSIAIHETFEVFHSETDSYYQQLKTSV